ncbi:hypothetical protein HUJ05_009128 [Dendroctonus ponderosae]|nr:hypothetical protein HUJ05_009128 [Dendroctonus ponderosae]
MNVLAPTLLVAIFLASSNAVCSQVSNVVLSSNYSLSWSEASNPHNCTISNYVVEVLDDEDSATIFQVQTVKNILHYNFNFLDMCKSYSFNVHALTSDFVLGPADSYSATTEPLDSANLTLAYVELDETEGSDDVMEVSWDLASDEASRCVTSYRVSYWDERNKPQEQFVSAKSFAFEEEAACRNYSLQVSAIIGNPDIEGPALTAVFPGHSKVPDVPTSANVSPTSNSATMIWKLEAYEKNLCTMLALNVRTLGAPNDETNLRILVTDNLLRPDVIVTLTGLSANTVYTSYVNAENIAGTSKDVTVMFQTTDELKNEATPQGGATHSLGYKETSRNELKEAKQRQSLWKAELVKGPERRQNKWRPPKEKILIVNLSRLFDCFQSTAEGEAAAAQDEAAAPAAEAAGEDEYLDPDKLLLFKHWIRPRFLPYKYLTDYRRNYYDDVIDYLDKRCRGIFRDIPVAQTWGERVLRTYTKNSNQAEIFRQKLQDRKLIEETRFSGKFQLHHSKSYINTRYSSILPKYLQYKCIYDYRRSYYDDVLEAIESRRKGYRRRIPRPQTWAERVLRTSSDPLHRLESFDAFLEDVKLVTRSEISGRIYSSQVASNFNRRYTEKINF